MSIYANMDLSTELKLVNRFGQMLPVKIDEIDFHPLKCEPEFRGRIISNHVRLMGRDKTLAIKKVIFNDSATIVIWDDNTKTVVKCKPGDTYSKEVGLAMCIAKKYLGNEYKGTFKKYIPQNNLDTEDMRRELSQFCDRKICRDCPLSRDDCRCGRGVSFTSKSADGNYCMTDKEIVNAYKIVFGNKEV